MDLITLSNGLKNLSDEQLQSMRSSPEVPPYLLVAEMSRRNEMRKEYQAANSRVPGQQPSVAQGIAQQFQQRPPQQMPPQMQGGPPQINPSAMGIGALGHMAHGGYIHGYDDGGEVDDTDFASTPEQAPAAAQTPARSADPSGLVTTVDQYNQMYPQASMDEAISKARAAMQGSDRMGPISEELAALSAQYRNQRPNMWRALANAGFAMAAEPTHSFGRAAGIAGLTAMQSMDQQRQAQQENYLKALQDRINVAKTQEGSDDRIAQLAGHLYSNGNARSNTIANVLAANQRAMLGNDEHQAALAIQNANPGMPYANARVLAQQKIQENSDRIKAAEALAKGRESTRHMAPDVQMLDAAVAGVANKYGIKGVGDSAPVLRDLPLAAQQEVSEILAKRNPTLYSIALRKFNGDAGKAGDWLLKYHMSSAKANNPDAALAPPPINYSPQGGRLVE